MAYRQTPGRGPMATFKNVSALLGPTANGVDPKTGVKNTGKGKTVLVGGNVNYMIEQGYQPKGEFVNDRGTRIVKYMNKKGDSQYHQFNNKADSDNKLHKVIDQKTYRDLLSRGQGDRRTGYSKFKRAIDVAERDMSGALNKSMTDQVTKGKMAANFEKAS
tara:strand:- start:28 stop:510 length:483 start_codon:yes stop_codon:yes gene_type:complete